MTRQFLGLRVYWALIVFMAGGIGAEFWFASGAASQTRKMLRVDLKTVGYALPTAEREVRAYDFLRDAVAFIDDGKLAVSFLTRNEHPGASKRDGTAGGMYLFHTAFVNPKTGQVLAKRSWGNAGNWNTILPLEDGRFFVQDAEWIGVYGKDYEEISKQRMEVVGDILPRFVASASGQTLYEFRDGYDRKMGWLTRVDVLDPTTLERSDSTVTPMQADETVSDDRVVYSSPKFKDQLRLFVYKAKGAAQAHDPLLLKADTFTAKAAAKSHCQSATLIQGELLAITGDCPKILLLRGDDEYDEVEFLDYRIGREVRASRDGRRIAFVRYPKGDSPRKISRIELCVYDLRAKKLEFVESVRALPRWKFGFALSGDGGMVAAVSDDLLEVWRVGG